MGKTTEGYNNVGRYKYISMQYIYINVHAITIVINKN